MNFINSPEVKKKIELAKSKCEHCQDDGICNRDFGVCGYVFDEGCYYDLFVEFSTTYPTLGRILNDLGIPTVEEEINGIIKRIYANSELKAQEHLSRVSESQRNLFQFETTTFVSGSTITNWSEVTVRGRDQEDEEENAK